MFAVLDKTDSIRFASGDERPADGVAATASRPHPNTSPSHHPSHPSLPSTPSRRVSRASHRSRILRPRRSQSVSRASNHLGANRLAGAEAPNLDVPAAGFGACLEKFPSSCDGTHLGTEGGGFWIEARAGGSVSERGIGRGGRNARRVIDEPRASFAEQSVDAPRAKLATLLRVHELGGRGHVRVRGTSEPGESDGEREERRRSARIASRREDGQETSEWEDDGCSRVVRRSGGSRTSRLRSSAPRRDRPSRAPGVQRLLSDAHGRGVRGHGVRVPLRERGRGQRQRHLILGAPSGVVHLHRRHRDGTDRAAVGGSMERETVRARGGVDVTREVADRRARARVARARGVCAPRRRASRRAFVSRNTDADSHLPRISACRQCQLFVVLACRELRDSPPVVAWASTSSSTRAMRSGAARVG